MFDDLLENETEKREKNYINKLIEANTKLVDKLNWIKEDIERETYRIKTVGIKREEIIKDLEKMVSKY